MDANSVPDSAEVSQSSFQPEETSGSSSSLAATETLTKARQSHDGLEKQMGGLSLQENGGAVGAGGTGAAVPKPAAVPSSHGGARPKERQAEASSMNTLTPAGPAVAVPGGFTTMQATRRRGEMTNQGGKIYEENLTLSKDTAPKYQDSLRNMDGGTIVNLGDHSVYYSEGCRVLNVAKVDQLMTDAPDGAVLDNEPTPGMRAKYQPLLGSTREVTTDDIQDVHGKVGKQWKELARILHFDESDIENIEYRERELKEMTYQLLLQWLERDAERATISALAGAIFKLDTDNNRKSKLLDRLDP